ncbi:MAG: PVC-type heme-binding CxxCH protein [Pirellulales bacterium]
MTPHKLLCAFLVYLGESLCLFAVATAAPQPEWRPLFNGKDLDGWHTIITGHGLDSDPDKLIQIEDGVIHLYKDAAEGSDQPCGFICTEEKFDRYRLRFQYKWGQKRFADRSKSLRDAGCLIHIPEIKSVHGVWPMSIECQVQEGDTGDLITVDTGCTAFVDPATKDADYPTFRDPSQGGIEHKNEWYINADKTRDRLTDWNTVEVVVCGSEAAAYVVNGEVNQRFKGIRRPDGKGGWTPLGEGHIAFQLEDAEVFYRNIEIQPLPEGVDAKQLLSAAAATIAPVTPDEAKEKAAVEAASRTKSVEVPAGFTLELAAESPLVEHPMMACLDDRGRLFVAESDGQNREAQQLLDETPHKILMLEDTDGDGTFDTRTVFADKLVLPNGAQWYDGALYVCSPPFIWRFRDLDGDGRADERTPIAGTFNFDGMSSAFHGPVLGPDGRLYWSGGQHGWMLESTQEGEKRHRADPKKLGYDSGFDGPWTRYAPGAFSCWPDGSDAECLANGGICNPVETAFTPEGEVFGTVAVFDYVENQRRDAVVHWIDGGIFNLAEKNYKGLIRTGKDLIPLSYRGHAAPSGILRYRGDQFGPEYRDNFFFTEFNMHKVYRLQVERRGASFTSQDQVFLSSTHPDTHFTDVIEDADGSLLVIDTGGWFRYGCPTSQIAKPNIEGKIFRIRRAEQAPVADARGGKLDWESASNEELIARLGDARFAVRDRAVAALSKHGDAAVPALSATLQSGTGPTRLLAVQALTQIHTAQARNAVRAALADKDFPTRLAAVHDVCLHRDVQATEKLISLLGDAEPAVRREAATALGRIKTPTAVPALLDAAATDDPFLSHALTLGLIRIGNGEGTLPGLTSDLPAVKRTALVALDQMKSPLLTRDQVVGLLDSSDSDLEAAALAVLNSRPDWAGDIASRLAEWLQEQSPNGDRAAAIRGVIASCSENDSVRQTVAKALNDDSTPTPNRLLILEAIGSIDSDQLPEAWQHGIEKCLADADPLVIRQAIATIGARHQALFMPQLTKISETQSLAAALRLAAISAVVKQSPHLSAELFAFLTDQCANSDVSIDRLAAAQAIGGAQLNSDERAKVLQLVSQAGPLELPALVNVFETGGDEQEGKRLVGALQSSPGLSSISGDRLMKLIAKYPSTVHEAAAPLLAQLSSDAAGQADKLQHLVDALGGGDPGKGHEVFLSTQAACSTCHRVGAEGGTIGPNLSQIGQIRTKRDLIEAIVFPSASFARGFEPYVVVTTEGKVFNGIIGRETAESIYLRGSDRSETRVARDEIEEMDAGAASIMPKGLDEILSESQLRDLIAFLMSRK